MKTTDIRRQFIQFFQEREHTLIPSASTVPTDDKTILFTVAGMTQFKSAFSGEKKFDYLRATNSQKCIRVADLDDVGKDGRHLTMFEMLGSWSFGDYYKEEAIQWAYEFVRDVIALDLSRVWISVHHTDEESAEIWTKQGIPADRIVRLEDKDNFWAMGPTGPCGPCTEMYYDQGAKVGSCYQANIACKGPGCECDRFLEFWNLVFMQFQRHEDGTLADLPMKSVDTGMGLERLAALLQKKSNVFDIDIFQAISNRIISKANIQTTIELLTPEMRECVNVIADHIRFLCFTISDGVNFSNEGRGYVLRRVLRRATRFVHKLCPEWPQSESFLKHIVSTVINELSEFFPELVHAQKRIETLISTEELKFNKTLESGLQKFYEFLEATKADNKHILSGSNVFILHDTFGFPADLTKVLCAENNFDIDMQGYETCMIEQKDKSRTDSKFYKFTEDHTPWVELNAPNQEQNSSFDGYFLKSNYIKNNVNYFQKKFSFDDITKIRQLKNRSFELVMKNPIFYPEGGGQISDQGFIEVVNGKDVFTFEVLDVKKNPAFISHILRHEELSNQQSSILSEQKLKNLFHPSIELYCSVNLHYRTEIARNHTATHLLHKSLQTVLGDNVRQAGSLVKNDLLRFDFSHSEALTNEQKCLVENLVNQEILKNTPINTHENVTLEQAQKMGAMAMFNEKYDTNVRVLEIDKFSIELCGGTHVFHTAEIGQLKILSDSSVTSGVRRIEAVTGQYALEYTRTLEHNLNSSSELLKCAPVQLSQKITQTKEQVKDLEKQVLALQNKLSETYLQTLLSNAKIRDEFKIITAYLPNISVQTLEMLCDKIKAKPNHIAILATTLNGKSHIIAGMHPQIIEKDPSIHLGKVVRSICEQLKGKGGGRPDFAKGSGLLIDNLDSILLQTNL